MAEVLVVVWAEELVAALAEVLQQGARQHVAFVGFAFCYFFGGQGDAYRLTCCHVSNCLIHGQGWVRYTRFALPLSQVPAEVNILISLKAPLSVTVPMFLTIKNVVVSRSITASN